MTDIDMFPSKRWKQFPKYGSWIPDPESYIIGNMSTSWENTSIYAFPLLSMKWPTIKKTEKEAEKALIIVPMRPTHTWFIRELELATVTPIIIDNWQLYLPGTSKQHPLCMKLKLMAICYYRNKHQQIECREQLTKSSL